MIHTANLPAVVNSNIVLHYYTKIKVKIVQLHMTETNLNINIYTLKLEIKQNY